MVSLFGSEYLEPDMVSLGQSQQILPEYQERFLKDLLANVYYSDPETGQVSGIAAFNPLYGMPEFDQEGNRLYVTPDGGTTTDPTQAKVDQYGEPITSVIGGVPRPDIIQFDPAQTRAIEMGIQGIGMYEPLMEQAASTLTGGIGAYGEGLEAARASTGAYDPMSYKQYYDPFVDEVIENTRKDLQRQTDIERQRIGSAAVDAGAYGGSRQAIAEQELQRNAAQNFADISAKLRSAGFTGAQQQAQSAFENQMARGQSAGQIFGQLGQGIGQLGVQQGALGEAAQGAAQRDVNALFNLGSLNQAQQQAEYDVQRAGAIEEAYEPFQRFAYMSDIFRGVPSTSQTLSTTSVPTPNPVASILGTASSINAAGGTRGILGGLI